MFAAEVFLPYTLACLLLVVTPGPDNLLAMARGLSQGKRAAFLSAFASGTGILFHVLTATLGLTLLIHSSEQAFLLVKIIGASYLVWLGIKALKSDALFSLEAKPTKTFTRLFMTSFLSAALNPKPGLFVLAFIPQFIDPKAGSVTTQMLAYGIWFALLTCIGFGLMGASASKLSSWLKQKPGIVKFLNTGSGMAFIWTGLGIALVKPV